MSQKYGRYVLTHRRPNTFLICSIAMQAGGTSKEDYDMKTTVGQGAYGTVYKAIDIRTNKMVAVKVIELENDWLPLLSEVNMVIDLSHASIVNYYNWFFYGNCLWLVMEFCDGGSLCDIMETLNRSLDEFEISSIMRGVLESLIYVHERKMIHRDIKGGNVLVTSDGLVKLCDFGVSARMDDTMKSKISTRIGSPCFMAPEVVAASGYDTQADIWSLGITALEMLSRHPPRADMGQAQVLKAVIEEPVPVAPEKATPEFKAFVERMLIKDPTKRATAVQLMNDPFIANIAPNVASEIVRSLATTFIQQKVADKEEEDDEEEEDEDEEEEEEEEEDGNELYAGETIIQFDDDGFADTRTMKVLSDETWREDPDGSTDSLAEARNMHFGNFKESDLRVMLTNVKSLAQKELEDGILSAKSIRDKYEEVRVSIVEQLQSKCPDIPDDFESLKL